MADVVPIISALASTTIEGAITGIAKAFDTVPSNVDLPLPCFINMPLEGTIGGIEEGTPELSGTRTTFHHIKVQLLVSLQSDLADADLQARPYLRRFVGTVDNFKTLNGTANVGDAAVQSYRYGGIQLREGEPGYLGWTFLVVVRETEQNIVYKTTGPAL